MMSKAQKAQRKRDLEYAYQLGWNAYFLNGYNPYLPRLQRPEYNAFERGRSQASMRGIMTIPIAERRA